MQTVQLDAVCTFRAAVKAGCTKSVGEMILTLVEAVLWMQGAPNAIEIGSNRIHPVQWRQNATSALLAGCTQSSVDKKQPLQNAPSALEIRCNHYLEGRIH